MAKISFTQAETSATKRYGSLILPVIFLSVLILLSFVIFKFGIAGAISLNDELKEAKKKEAMLSEKQVLLSTFSADNLRVVQKAQLAVPSDNPATSVLRLIRIVANQSAVNIKVVNIGKATTDDSGLSKVGVTIDVSGTHQSVVSFVRTLLGETPIVTLNSINFGQNPDKTFGANLVLSAFSAKMPTQLSKVDEPIKDLTSEEKTVLSKINALTAEVTQGLSPQAPGGRTSPF